MPTLVIKPTPTTGNDTYINSGFADTNYGTSDYLWIGEVSGEAWVTRTLIKFDLTLIPPRATISSVILSLYLLEDKSTNNHTYYVHRQKRAWVETQATWNIYSTGNNWQTAGGFDTDDCEWWTYIGKRDFTSSESNGWKHFPLTPTTIAGLDLGYGWMIKAGPLEANDAYKFVSSNYTAQSTWRPKLTIVYSLPYTYAAVTM